MKTAVLFLACLAFAAADYVYPKSEVKFADKQFLEKQKFFFDVLLNIHEPLIKNDKYYKDGAQYVEGDSYYKNYTLVDEFFKMYKYGMLPRNAIFSIANEQHLKETMALFHFFYYSKDWTTFYKNVLWARQYVNEGMFVYALTVAVAHRDDMTGIVLPPIYEICPYMFFTAPAISEGGHYKMKGQFETEPYYKVWANYSDYYYNMNKESKLAYFTEDIGWNSYFYYFHIDYPFWMGGKEFNLYKDRRGDQFLYMYQQLLARYYLERLSNGMGKIPEFSWHTPIKYGYNPHLTYYNGLGFTVRKNYYEVYSTHDYHTLNLIEDHESKIRSYIQYGYMKNPDGEVIHLREPESIEYLGNYMMSNPDYHESYGFYDYYTYTMMWRKLMGGASYEYYHDYKIIPSVMEHCETLLRDPATYQVWKHLMKFYYEFKKYLPYYKYEELDYPGIKIENVDVGKLVTYFDVYESDITNAYYFGDFKPYPLKYNIMAKQMRLNHKPFVVSIDVNAEKSQKAVVRIYMGPKYDEYGGYAKLSYNRDNFVEIDQFVYELSEGKTTIKRDSKDFYYSVKDRTTYFELYKSVMLALEGDTKFPLDMSEAHCGFPDRLLLPKGWVEGMPMQFFVMLTPATDDVKQYSTYDHTISCGVGSGSRYADKKPFGYPFDREINEVEFYTPNMYFKDVYVYHKMDKNFAHSLY